MSEVKSIRRRCGGFFTAKNRELKFAQYVAEVLRKANILFKTDVNLGGIRPDFLLEAPDGRVLIVEVKSWDPTRSNRIRAIKQAQLFKEATGADQAFIVVKGMKRGVPSKGLVTVKKLADVILTEFKRKKVPKKRRIRIPPPTRKTIFAAMPFSSKYDDVFLVAMAHAAKSVNVECKRIDYEEFEGDIVEEIKRLINKSIAVIADLSESKPNVLYEVGYAHALKRPTIHICSTPLKKLPFDVRNWNTIKYEKGRTYKLRGKLARRLRALLRRRGGRKGLMETNPLG